jgi:hypothetical protein
VSLGLGDAERVGPLTVSPGVLVVAEGSGTDSSPPETPVPAREITAQVRVAPAAATTTHPTTHPTTHSVTARRAVMSSSSHRDVVAPRRPRAG